MAKILCIDDELDVLESCSTILKSKGHIIKCAGNGTDGYKEALNFKPDLIILDVMMDSHTDGFHAAYQFRNNEKLKNIPILMLTSINQISKLKFNKEKDGQFLPVDEFMEKPIVPQKLLAEVDRLLGLKEENINREGVKNVY
ncbi:MAG: response regulator [Oligoflexia bacterium]|nr:response regulator [Oligoflexia bacterium]